jgi:class 3 adenylate cyclase
VLTDAPDTRHTWSGEFSIAYQAIGEGPSDLLYLPQFFSNVAWNWQVPDHARFIRRLAAFSRLIVMDPRGVGCSDRLPPSRAATLEEQVDDVLAVLSATTSFGATILAGGRSAFVAMVAAATHPERLEGLVLFGATPTWIRSDELPWQDSPEELERTLAQMRTSASNQEWARVWARRFAPSLSDADIASLASYGDVTTGRGAMMTETEMLGHVDLRPLLPTIRVPTLLLHRTEDPLESVESGRLLAAKIPGSRLVELPGRDALMWMGDADVVADEIQAFLTGDREAPAPDRILATVLFTDVVDSTARSATMGDRAWRALREAHDRLVRDEVAGARGRVIKSMGDGYLATFDGPARGIAAAEAIVAASRDLGIAVRTGVHTGEIELDGDDVAGIGVAIGARIAAIAGPSEVLVSQTVRDLVVGAGVSFDDAGEHELKGVPGRWRLYRVSS